MSIWNTGNKPPTADPALEFVAVKCIGPVHNKLKIVELVPFLMQNCLGCLFRVYFIKTCVNFSLFRALEIQLPPFFGIGRFRLIFGGCFFPFAKGKGSKADINITVFNGWDFLFALLMDTGEILRLIGWNPFPFILLQTPCPYKL